MTYVKIIDFVEFVIKDVEKIANVNDVFWILKLPSDNSETVNMGLEKVLDTLNKRTSESQVLDGEIELKVQIEKEDIISTSSPPSVNDYLKKIWHTETDVMLCYKFSPS